MGKPFTAIGQSPHWRTLRHHPAVGSIPSQIRKSEKYTSTTEKVLKATRAYLPPAGIRRQLERLGWLTLTNYIVRNADCHTKNIALYYSSLADVAYTPVYDIVTTQAYPRYASNPPALSINGRKTWTPGKALVSFFNARLGIPPPRFATMVEALCDAAVATANEVVAAAKNEPRWHTVAKQMLCAWNDGMTALRTQGPARGNGQLQPIIQAAGFSDRDPPASGRVTIGRSELLAKPNRKRNRRKAAKPEG